MKNISLCVLGFLSSFIVLGCSSPNLGANLTAGETQVALDKAFTFNFIAPVDRTTVSSTSFFLVQTSVSENVSAPVLQTKFISTLCDPVNAIAATVVCSSDISCTLTPTSALSPNAAYSLCLTSDIHYSNPSANGVFPGEQIDFTSLVVTYSVTPGDTIHGGVSPSTAQTINSGRNINFTATPDTHYHVNQWLVDGSVVQTGGSTYTLPNIIADHTVSVTFNIDQYTVTSSAGTHGIISPSTEQTIDATDDQVFTATPDRGYDIYQWSVDGSVVQTGGSPYTLTNVTANHAVAVSFAQQHYTIGGSISRLTTSGLVLQNLGGDDVTISANATSYQFAGTAVYGNAYVITVLSQPAHQYCTVSNASDVNFSNDITNANITCIQLPIAYVSSSNTNELFRCTVNRLDGTLSDCTLISPPDPMSPWSPFAVAFADVNDTPHAFVADNNSSSSTVCSIDIENGDLNDCLVTGSFGGAPTGVAVATIGEIPYVYIGDNVASHLYRCTLNSNGTINACVDTTPAGLSTWDPSTLAFATVSGTQYAYVVDGNTTTIFQCSLNATNGNFVACTDLFPSGSPLSFANALTFATVNGTQYAYVPDGISSGDIYRCSLANDGTFSACSVSLASPPAWNPRAISFANVNDTPYAYVGDISGNIYICTVHVSSNPSINGTFDTCTITPSTGAPAWEPRGVTVQTIP